MRARRRALPRSSDRRGAEPTIDRARRQLLLESIAWETEKPVAVGSRIEFVARFLGRALEYTIEVTTDIPGEHLLLRTAEGPFPMETSYR